MVVGAFPIAKLGALLLKQISKPIANAVKEQAKSSPVFRKYVCLPPAKFYNWCEEKAKMWVLNLGRPVSVPVYNEKMAIELGANLLGEGIIFVIAAGVLIAEYNRSSRKETAKEAAKQKEIDDLKMAVKELFIQTEEQGTYIRELRRKVGDLDTKFSKNKSKPSDSPPSPPPFILDNKKFSDSNKSIAIDKEKEVNGLLNLSSENVRNDISHNFLLKTVSEIENEFWNYESLSERKPSILNRALEHLYQNVYKLELEAYM